MTKPKPKRNKPMPRIEARFDALTLKTAETLLQRGHSLLNITRKVVVERDG